MTTKDKIIFGAVVVVISLLAGWGIGKIFPAQIEKNIANFGAVGNQLFENYNSYVRQNGGINTNDPITVGNTLTATTLTVTGVQTANGVSSQTVRQALVSGTSTPCSIQNPLSATSTVTFSMNITTATSSAIAWSVGTSTTAFATSSTMVKNALISANLFGNVTWDPGVNNGVVGPNGSPMNSWVLIGPDNLTANTTGAFTSIVITGFCQATFTSII